MTARRILAYVLVVIVAGAICGIAYRNRDPGPLRLEIEIDHSHHPQLRGER